MDPRLRELTLAASGSHDAGYYNLGPAYFYHHCIFQPCNNVIKPIF